MKNARKFEDVKIGDEVSFINQNKQIETALVSDVEHNKFTLRTISIFKNPETNYTKIKDMYWSFFKTGTKTHHRYICGNALEIINRAI